MSRTNFEQVQLEEMKQMLTVLTFKVGLPLYFLFWFMDLAYVPQYKWEFLAIRCTMIPAALIIYFSLKHTQTIAQAEYIALFLIIVCASILNTMIFTVGKGALYSIPLHLVALGALGFLPWRRYTFIVAAFFIYGPYLAIQATWLIDAGSMNQLVVDAFFISGVLVIVWFAKSYRDRLRNTEFSIRNDLEKEIEKRIQTEQELIIARDKAMAATLAKDSFLANMSHEIRTPLTAIIGFAEYALDDGLTLDERLYSLQTIVSSGNHLLNIINDILDFSKVEADSIEVEHIETDPIGIAYEVQTLVMPLASKKGLDVNIEYEFPVPVQIMTDPVRLKQILINICSNAIKFTEHGEVTISLAYEQKSDSMIFKIKDTGIGMSPEQQEKIFEPFKQADTSITRQYGGTGLGLSLSKRLAELLGGSLTVISKPNQGSEFTVSISAGGLSADSLINDIDEIVINKVGMHEGNNECLLKGHVLLAEDNENNQQLFTLYLNKMGVQVTCAENGAIAVENANKHDFDLVLMDMQMPVMSGIDAVKILRQSGYTKPIIALTANATKEDRRLCLEVGFNDFVTKPITRDRLYNAVLSYLPIDSISPQKSTEPLSSKLLEEYPEFSDIVHSFVSRLPNMVNAIRQAYDNQDWSNFKYEVHSLKGAGGNIGYPLVTELCVEMEKLLLQGNYSLLKDSLENLNALVERIETGMPEII